MRTAATDKQDPSSWSNVSDANAPHGAGEINTGDLGVTPGSNMWVQFGISSFLSTAGTGQASISAALGVRRG